ncbi:MAG: transposase [Solirubrobacteraceae bacterium]
MGLVGGRRGDDQGAAEWLEDRAESHRKSETGAKRSILTEAAGVPVGIAHAGANRHDQRLLTKTLESIPIERPEAMSQAPRGVCLDRAYDAPPIYALAEQHRVAAHIRTARRGDRRQAAHPRLARPPAGSSTPAARG